MIKQIPWKDHVSWKELADLWEINDFELGRYIEDLGLKYDQDPKKIYDPECSERTRKEHSFEEMLFNTKLRDGLKILDPRRWKDPWLDGEQAKQAARIRFEAQSELEVVDHPEDCIIFKPEYIIEFQDEHSGVFLNMAVPVEFVRDEIIDQRTAKVDISEEKEPQKPIKMEVDECLEDPEFINLIKDVRAKLDSFYDLVKKYLKEYDFPTCKLAELTEKEWAKGTTHIFIQKGNEFEPPIKEEYLRDKTFYKLDPGHPRRDFIGRLLQKIVKDRYPENSKWWGNSEKLYDRSQKIKKSLLPNLNQ